MRKVIEAKVLDEGLLDFVVGTSGGKSLKGFPKKKIIQDILYYQRKCISLLRRLQMIPEGVEESVELKKMTDEIEKLKSDIEEMCSKNV